MDSFIEIVSQGYAWAYLVAFLYGLATSLTPCVYPMIVITVSIFGAKQEQSRIKAILLALFFITGISITYTSLGIISAIGGMAFGSVLSHPVAVMLISIIFILLSLNMFGLYEINLPSSIQSKLNKIGGPGYIGALLMGLVSGILAAPCTGPITLGMMTWISTTKNIFLGASFFFVYSIGLGTLFFIVAVFSLSLPKSGKWLDSIKTVLGVTMVLLAIYYLQNIIPSHYLRAANNLYILLIGFIILFAGIAAGGIHLSIHSTNFYQKTKKVVGIILLNIGSIMILLYVLSPLPGTINWETDIDAGFAKADQQNRPVIIDFTANWCEACKEIDKLTFSDSEVADEIKRFIPIRVDSTIINEEIFQIQYNYKILGLPTIIIFNSRGQEIKRINQIIPPQTMVKILQNIH